MSPTPTNRTEPIALIIDTSSSAVSNWEETRQIAQQIYSLAASEKFKLFSIGNSTPIFPNILRQILPPGYTQHSQVCSLIAPIMEELVHQDEKHLVIIIGSGEIFDLEDWIADPHISGWLLIRTGMESLQRKSGNLSEITPNLFRDMESLFSYISQTVCEPTPIYRYSDREGGYQWIVDKSGYPLIWVDTLGAYVHLFPITKPQFERFIAASKHQEFGDEWYTEILKLNQRESYRSQDITAREQLFLTGIKTDEVAVFSKWLGHGYTLLTAADWCSFYKWCEEKPAPSIPDELRERLSKDAQAIWAIIQGHKPSTFKELSLMTQGILEWVIEEPGRFCGLGDPASAKFLRKPFIPIYPISYRHKDFGFRLQTRVI